MSELRITTGPVVIVQVDLDPGDFGEPRIIHEAERTIVFVPSFDLWPVDEDPGPATVPPALTAERLAELLDEHLPRMAFVEYGRAFTADPDFDLPAYYRRVAEAMLEAVSPPAPGRPAAIAGESSIGAGVAVSHLPATSGKGPD